jgi:hypothetical protein
VVTSILLTNFDRGLPQDLAHLHARDFIARLEAMNSALDDFVRREYHRDGVWLVARFRPCSSRQNPRSKETTDVDGGLTRRGSPRLLVCERDLRERSVSFGVWSDDRDAFGLHWCGCTHGFVNSSTTLTSSEASFAPHLTPCRPSCGIAPRHLGAGQRPV